jgi:hypothetical protein
MDLVNPDILTKLSLEIHQHGLFLNLDLSKRGISISKHIKYARNSSECFTCIILVEIHHTLY